MSLSSSQICSKALVLLGQNPITDIDDVTVPNAVKCKAAYESERNALLREYDWGFARRRSVLQQTTTPDFGYAYAYTLPADCCAVRIVNDNLYPYETEYGAILTDWDTCSLVYTAYVEETGRFDSLFVDCLAARIARSLAYSLLKKLNVMQAMDALYNTIRPMARKVDASESIATVPDGTDSWISARGSTSDSSTDVTDT